MIDFLESKTTILKQSIEEVGHSTDNLIETFMYLSLGGAALLVIIALLKKVIHEKDARPFTLVFIFTIVMGIIAFPSIAQTIIDMMESLSETINPDGFERLTNFFVSVNDEINEQKSEGSATWEIIRGNAATSIVEAINESLFGFFSDMVASLINFGVYIQEMIIAIMAIFAPWSIALILFEGTKSKGISFVLSLIAVASWPVFWSISMLLVTNVIILQTNINGIGPAAAATAGVNTVLFLAITMLLTPFIAHALITKGIQATAAGAGIKARELFQTAAAYKTFGGSKVAQGAMKSLGGGAKGGSSSPPPSPIPSTTALTTPSGGYRYGSASQTRRLRNVTPSNVGSYRLPPPRPSNTINI